MGTGEPGIALAHDYVTQRGGAERVALSLARAFPGAPLHTTLYEPDATFPAFAGIDVRPMSVNRWAVLRRHHRLALPVLARAVDGCHVDADILVASSSGWAHGIHTTGRKIVYCHAPARWLYQTDRYAGGGLRASAVRMATGVLGRRLRAWDQAAAHSAHRYLVNSTVIQRQVAAVYGIQAEVLPPPPAPLAGGVSEPVAELDGPFLLCVARLLPYKNVDAVIDAVSRVPGVRLAVVGEGPDRRRLESRASRSAGRVRLLGRVSDARLRWLYENCTGLVAASYEDFGLSPLEAASFGKPTAALRDGGYLDTVVDGVTGVFFDTHDADAMAAALEAEATRSWDAAVITAHADTFSEDRFIARIRAVVEEERARA